MDIVGPGAQFRVRTPGAPMGGRAESTYRYTVIDTIGGGASEIQKNIIARRKPRPAEELLIGRAGNTDPRRITVLDLAYGRAGVARSRRLADYGADVVKVGPVPKLGRVQIVPPFLAYRRSPRDASHAGRPQGARGKARVPTSLQVRTSLIESFRPGVDGALGIGFDDVRARKPRHRATARRADTARTAHTRSGPATTSTTSRSADSSRPAARADGGPPFRARRSPTARAAACTR